MTSGAEPTWGGAGAVPAGTYAAAQYATARVVSDVDGAGPSSTKELESEVYAARDVHGDDRTKLRRKLTRARSSMSDTSYRRALELARDSVLLTIEECIEGALAMEWEPLPRPEFSLASIEAAVAEQERAEREHVEHHRTESDAAEQERGDEEVAAQEAADEEPAEEEPGEQTPTDHEMAAQETADEEPAGQEPEAAEQAPTDHEMAAQETADEEPAGREHEAAAQTPAAGREPGAREAAEPEQAEREPSGTSRRAG